MHRRPRRVQSGKARVSILQLGGEEETDRGVVHVTYQFDHDLVTGHVLLLRLQFRSATE